jgi:L,D-transpeptidase catalytic domain
MTGTQPPAILPVPTGQPVPRLSITGTYGQGLDRRKGVLLLCGWLYLFVLLPSAKTSWARDLELPPLWAVPEALVYSDAGLYDHPGLTFAMIVDKSRQQVNLYRYDGYWRKIGKWPCSTGRLDGPKESEGDRRTPEGVYFVTRDVGPRFLSDTYGARALPLDYPNWLDRHLSHTGSAIWLHGTNRALQERDSNGCVVLENETIELLTPYLRLNRTPVIIVDRLRLWAVKDSRKAADAILSAARQWHAALIHGSYADFVQWYEPQAAPSKNWWQKWCRCRQASSASHCHSLMAQRAIYRWGDSYLLLFDHVLSGAEQSRWVGRRKLYWRLNGNRVHICGDTYQVVFRRYRDPLLRAWRLFNTPGKKDSRMAANEKSKQTNYSVE